MGFLKFYVGPDYISFQTIAQKTIESLPDFKPFYVSCELDHGESLAEALTTSFLFDNNKLIIANLTGITETYAKSFLTATDIHCLAFSDKLPSKIVSILKKSGDYINLPNVSLNNLNSKITSIAGNLGISLSTETKNFILSKKSTDLHKMYNALNQCKTGNIISPTPAHLKILLNSLEKETPPWELLDYIYSKKKLPENFVVETDQVFQLVGFLSKTLTQATTLRLVSFENKLSFADACAKLEIPAWQQKQYVPLARLSDKNFEYVLDSFNDIIENIYSQNSSYYVTKFLVSLCNTV